MSWEGGRDEGLEGRSGFGDGGTVLRSGMFWWLPLVVVICFGLFREIKQKIVCRCESLVIIHVVELSSIIADSCSVFGPTATF